MLDYISLGKKIYNTENPREARRMVVFVGRCLLNMGRMKRLYQFFTGNALLNQVAEEYPLSMSSRRVLFLQQIDVRRAC